MKGKEKGQNFYRAGGKLAQWKMLRGGKPTRDAEGNITEPAPFQNPNCAAGKIEASRNWFATTRSADQRELEQFREQLAGMATDAYKVILDRGQVPMSLIKDAGGKPVRPVTSYEDTFGKKATRKRVKMAFSSMEELAEQTRQRQGAGQEACAAGEEAFSRGGKEKAYLKGQSKRIWAELYKVLDSSDVVVHILDARNPQGTECTSIKKYIGENVHKHLVYLLNKVDLVPTGITAKWLAHFSQRHPTLAYHAASIDRSYGKQSLVRLLRQFARLHPEKKQISVGFVGYPNVGKSSVINSLRSKNVCTVAPVPGETKVWQYISLMKRIYLIDCPGIVPPADKDETSVVLKGVVRVENISAPEDHVEALLEKAGAEHIKSVYGIEEYAGHVDFLEKLAKKSGRLLKGGVPDVCAMAKIVIHDWLRGRIPYYECPPGDE